MDSKKAKTAAKANGNGTTPVKMPVVAPAGAAPLAATLPDVIALRCSFADSNVEQLAVVTFAFGMSKQCDKRLETVTAADLAGHGARRITAPRAALVRSSNPLVTLVVEAFSYMGQTRGLQLLPVASFHKDEPGKLPRDPERSTHELSTEARARVHQVLDDLSDQDAMRLTSHINEEKFRDTVAERVEVEAVIYQRPTSSSGILWVKHRDLIWPVCLVRGEALRRVEPEATNYTIDEWHARGTTERGYY